MKFCDAAHSTRYTSPPAATVDLGSHRRVVGLPGYHRFLCDKHVAGIYGWRDKLRLPDAPPPTVPA